MSFEYPYLEGLKLHVADRISEDDASRQERTAREILRRLKHQPGVVLADEVGMGKTFVALAVATSVIAAEKEGRPVVVMVPPSLIEKWPRDFKVFAKKCLPGALSTDLLARIREGRADTAVEFLKLLDDPVETRKSIVFLTHGAMSRGINDDWVKVALIQRALKHRKDIEDIHRGLHRFLGDIVYGLGKIQRANPDIWRILLQADAAEWKRLLAKRCPEYAPDDDPVPEAIRESLVDINTDDLFAVLRNIPRRESKHFDSYCSSVGTEITDQLRSLWGRTMRNLKIKLPLLILDEAHHLKNAQTKVASLFGHADAHADGEELSSRGQLAEVFDRMLFLTATPFQLGHYELISVLDRFQGVRWASFESAKEARGQFERSLDDLREKLDWAQDAAIRLDTAWEKLTPQDLVIGEASFPDTESWWTALPTDQAGLSSSVQTALARYREARDKMRAAETALRPWIVRHIRRLHLPQTTIERRQRLIGAAIVPGSDSSVAHGLQVEGEALLPFLLAARAVASTPESRPVFAEGLASSYEAFLHTRQQRLEEKAMKEARKTGVLRVLDDDDAHENNEAQGSGIEIDWYLERIRKNISQAGDGTPAAHPKVGPTVKRIVDLWRKGEKVLVFCHYIATGRALRQAISDALIREINALGAPKLDCPADRVPDELEKLGKRFFDQDSPVRRGMDSLLGKIIHDYPNLQEERTIILDIVRRNLRTPSFLVRFFPLGERLTGQSVEAALQVRDASDVCLEDMLRAFFKFLGRCEAEERGNYLAALDKIQTGTHVGADVRKTFGNDELREGRSGTLIPNVRLANGQMLAETRQRLMLTFNTPFFPEVLISSSVLAEGVDLHLSCRHVIHHDLCWNPSTLEQRTGRVDRIGAKAEHCAKPIHVYLPYVAETQDQKMYQVVMDRERWFKVVMGNDFKLDVKTTDRLAQRLPLPHAAAEELSFKLDVV